MDVNNLFAAIPAARLREFCEELAAGRSFRLERIVSHGQSTPPGEWLEQERDEWVLLLQGEAGLLIHGETQPAVMRPGDYVRIPAGVRHRVEWTAPKLDMVWLALHHE